MFKFKHTITGSELVRYNANSAGRATGDCVKRSMSFAFDMPYNEMAKLLNAEMKDQREDAWNHPNVYRRVAKRLGGQDFILVEDPMTLDEFANSLGSQGTWLVETGKSPSSRRDHIVCVLDGKVYDSWDSRDQYVKYYAKVPHIIRNFTELDLRNYVDYIDNEVNNVLTKLIDKYEWGTYVDNVGAEIRMKPSDKYSCRIIVKMVLAPRAYHKSDSRYSFDFSIVCTPTTTPEDAEKIIKSTTKTRLYDRLYSINQQEQKMKNVYHEKSASDIPEHQVSFGWERNRCERFFNSLPSWVQARVTYLDIQQPGQYSDSYNLIMYGLPEWGEGQKKIEFRAYDASSMRMILDEYKKTGQVLEPWDY